MEGVIMEYVYYKCLTCGFVHQEPSYWSGHGPEDQIEMQHINLETKEFCNDIVLKIIEDASL